jgi:hypothetical protein
VCDLVTAPRSVAARVAEADFAALPFHLSFKCDGCLYNEYCMKWSAEHDDLSLLPHLTANDKTALRRCGVGAMRDLATIKAPAADAGTGVAQLVAAPGNEALVERLATTWPVGPRLDELIHRARRYRRWRGDPIAAPSHIPSKGYGSLPYCDAGHNPNLVRVYIDAQHDYLRDRLYLVGSLVVATEDGVERPERRRSIIRMTDGPPETAAAEERLLLDWIEATLRAVAELAAPGPAGERAAPIHLIFFDRYEQQVLLDALARHFARVVGATPLYDFLTQLAAFDSPVATFLDAEIRALKNYPMVCQSLQAVAAYLKFDWNSPAPYREIFRARLFDFWGKLNTPPIAASGSPESPWYTSRARFGSQIPLEYASAAWADLGDLGDARQDTPKEERDDLSAYEGATRELLLGFQARRLEAIEHIAQDFPGNKQTEKRPYALPDLAGFEDKARSLAQALDEFVTIERHVELGAWKSARLAAPERRVLSGETLLVRYREADQDPAVAATNRENLRRAELRERYDAQYRLDHPDARRVNLSDEQRKATRWSQDGLRVRLRLEADGLDCSVAEALAQSDLREGERVVIYPRWTHDGRLPPEQRVPFTPTPRQMLYGSRAEIARIVLRRDATGAVTDGYVELELRTAHGGGGGMRGFVFAGIDRPLVDGELYTLDPDPNDWYGYWCAKVVEGLADGAPSTLYARLGDPAAGTVRWPREAAEAQARFMAGLDALFRADALHDFEPGKRDYIGEYGDAPMLLVQGPPGTGKSYTTGFAVYARLQGALAAGMEYRVFVSCKTHAATDVLLRHIAGVRERLRLLRLREPALFARHFDERILTVPLFRVEPSAE